MTLSYLLCRMCTVGVVQQTILSLLAQEKNYFSIHPPLSLTPMYGFPTTSASNHIHTVPHLTHVQTSSTGRYWHHNDSESAVIAAFAASLDAWEEWCAKGGPKTRPWLQCTNCEVACDAQGKNTTTATLDESRDPVPSSLQSAESHRSSPLSSSSKSVQHPSRQQGSVDGEHGLIWRGGNFTASGRTVLIASLNKGE